MMLRRDRRLSIPARAISWLRISPWSLLCSVCVASLLIFPVCSLRAQASDHTPDRPVRTLTALGALPVGLTIPVEIHHTYRTGKTNVGTTIVATTTQRVPLGNHRYLRYGTQVVGTVVASEVTDKSSGQPATMTLRFDRLADHGQSMAISTAAVAVANFTDVEDTNIPANANLGRGTAEIASMTTHQIGEDEVCRSGWDGEMVDAHLRRVGFADHYGVYADPPANATGTAAIAHAMGVFSTTSTGLYGFGERDMLETAHGELTITSPHKVILRDGDNLLLKILPGR